MAWVKGCSFLWLLGYVFATVAGTNQPDIAKKHDTIGTCQSQLLFSETSALQPNNVLPLSNAPVQPVRKVSCHKPNSRGLIRVQESRKNCIKRKSYPVKQKKKRSRSGMRKKRQIKGDKAKMSKAQPFKNKVKLRLPKGGSGKKKKFNRRSLNNSQLVKALDSLNKPILDKPYSVKKNKTNSHSEFFRKRIKIRFTKKQLKELKKQRRALENTQLCSSRISKRSTVEIPSASDETGNSEPKRLRARSIDSSSIPTETPRLLESSKADTEKFEVSTTKSYVSTVEDIAITPSLNTTNISVKPTAAAVPHNEVIRSGKLVNKPRKKKSSWRNKSQKCSKANKRGKIDEKMSRRLLERMKEDSRKGHKENLRQEGRLLVKQLKPKWKQEKIGKPGKLKTIQDNHDNEVLPTAFPRPAHLLNMITAKKFKPSKSGKRKLRKKQRNGIESRIMYNEEADNDVVPSAFPRTVPLPKDTKNPLLQKKLQLSWGSNGEKNPIQFENDEDMILPTAFPRRPLTMEKFKPTVTKKLKGKRKGKKKTIRNSQIIQEDGDNKDELTNNCLLKLKKTNGKNGKRIRKGTSKGVRHPASNNLDKEIKQILFETGINNKDISRPDVKENGWKVKYRLLNRKPRNTRGNCPPKKGGNLGVRSRSSREWEESPIFRQMA